MILFHVPRRMAPWRRFAAGARGFSFLEIMLVVVIIGILISIIGPKMIGKSEAARVTATKAQINNIKTTLASYDMEIGSLPTTEQGLEALVERPSDVDENAWSQYMESLPRDAWGRAFVYRCPGENDADYDLFSMGKDGREDTEDDVWLRNKEEDFE